MYPNGKPTIWQLLDLTKTTNIGDGTSASKEDPTGSNASKGSLAQGKTHTPLAHEGPLIAMMLMILIGARLLVGHDYSTIGFASVMYFVMSTLGNGLHMSFHVRGFHLEKYQWYLELRALHYIHHLGDMKSNLGMFNLGLVDGFFGSLALEDPVSTRKRMRKHKSGNGIYSSMVADLTDAEKKAMAEGGLTEKQLLGAAKHAGIVGTALGFDVPLCVNESYSVSQRRGYPTVLLRLVIAGTGLYAWFQTEHALSEWLQQQSGQGTEYGAWIAPAPAEHYDPGHELFAPLRVWLETNGLVAAACALSATLADATGVIILIKSLLGSSFRPVLSVLGAFALRWCLHALGALQIIPLVADNLWELPPDWPTLFVQTGPSRHAFFSSRIAVTNVVAMELLFITVYSPQYNKYVRVGAAILAAGFLAFNISLTLALKVSLVRSNVVVWKVTDDLRAYAMWSCSTNWSELLVV
jgi:hypothetical protein